MKKSPSPKEPLSLPPAKSSRKKAATDNFSFFPKVYELVRQIPKGRVTSYGALAEASGLRITARMVGWAMYAPHTAQPPIPAHRVVNSSGVLSGKDHFQTPTLMQELLEQEGIIIKKDKIQDFKTVFWDPVTALKGTSKTANKNKKVGK